MFDVEQAMKTNSTKRAQSKRCTNRQTGKQAVVPILSTGDLTLIVGQFTKGKRSKSKRKPINKDFET